MKKQIVYSLFTGMILLISTGAWAQVVATDVNCTAPCISASEITNNAVTSTKIQGSAVTSAKIADGTIATGDVADSAITSAKISNNTITADDILDSTITASKINSTGLNADSVDGVSAEQFLQSGQSGTIGSLTVTDGNITSAGDICIGTCP